MSHELTRWLVGRGAETVVVACNTASAAALDTLRDEFDVPIVGMEPAVKPAAATSTSRTVAVFATAATFQGRLFESVVDRHATDMRILERACPQWVALVEAGVTDGPEARASVQPAVSAALAEGADTIVLGCTHFSYLGSAIAEAAGGAASIIDPAKAVAAQTLRVTENHGGTSETSFAASGDPDEFRKLVRLLTNLEIGEVVLPFHA